MDWISDSLRGWAGRCRARRHWLLQGDDLVSDVAGDAVQIAGLKRLLFAADEEDRSALQNHADLFVRMRVLLNNRMRSQIDHRKHHLFG